MKSWLCVESDVNVMTIIQIHDSCMLSQKFQFFVLIIFVFFWGEGVLAWYMLRVLLVSVTQYKLDILSYHLQVFTSTVVMYCIFGQCLQGFYSRSCILCYHSILTFAFVVFVHVLLLMQIYHISPYRLVLCCTAICTVCTLSDLTRDQKVCVGDNVIWNSGSGKRTIAWWCT